VLTEARTIAEQYDHTFAVLAAQQADESAKAVTLLVL
jgi:hypothetical protein